MKQLFYLLTCLAAVISLEAKANIVLPGIFSDNMVLQQHAEAELRGRASGTRVTVNVSWSDKTWSAEVNAGAWSLNIATPAGSYDPQTIVLRDDDSEITLQNVLIGEVWICSGQSNMEMTLRGFMGQPVDDALRTVLESTQYRDRIRMLRVGANEAVKPLGAIRGRWEVPTPETVLATSAVAYHFARTLTDAIGVPVGIVTASRSSSKIEAWMPQELLAGKFGYDVAAINADPAVRGIAKCGLLYNGMLAPLFGFRARGFLWYQGESNRDEPERYSQLLQELAADWRVRWSDTKNEMPFIYVQIAPYAYENNACGFDAPALAESQVRALELIPNAALVATTDVGEEKCIHPADKRTVGERAAVEALRKAYGSDLPDASGMRVREVAFTEGKALVTFDNARYGLLPTAEPVTGFEIAGADGMFHPAQARIVTSRPVVELSSMQVPKPAAVRYAFRNYVPCNLRNTLGYPAFPYRSDDRPLKTQRTENR